MYVFWTSVIVNCSLCCSSVLVSQYSGHSFLFFFQTPSLTLENNIEVLRNFQVEVLEKLVSGFESVPLKLLEKCPEFDSSIFLKLKSLRQKLKAKLKLTGALLKRKTSSEVSFSTAGNTDINESLVPSKEWSAKSSDLIAIDKISGRFSLEAAGISDANECFYDKTANRVSLEGSDFEEVDECFNGYSSDKISAVQNMCSVSDKSSSFYSPNILVTEKKPLEKKLSSSQDVNSSRTAVASLCDTLMEEQALRQPTKVAFKFKTPTSFIARSVNSVTLNMNTGNAVSLDGCLSQMGDNLNKTSSESHSALQSFHRTPETSPRLHLSTVKCNFSPKQSACSFNKPANQQLTSFSYPVVETLTPRSRSSK